MAVTHALSLYFIVCIVYWKNVLGLLTLLGMSCCPLCFRWRSGSMASDSSFPPTGLCCARSARLYGRQHDFARDICSRRVQNRGSEFQHTTTSTSPTSSVSCLPATFYAVSDTSTRLNGSNHVVACSPCVCEALGGGSGRRPCW